MIKWKLQLEIQYTDQLVAPVTWQPLSTETVGVGLLMIEDPESVSIPKRF
ncbi:MAG: hypothetical protein K9M45_02300 [Kiritimatiellales bacterium]|nr:hypothetical protein [Kiritimatiellales bacterium]